MTISIGSFTGSAAELKPLRILLGLTEEAPYAENAPADVHATFNAAVLGRLISTDENFNLRSDLLKSFSWNDQKKAYILELNPDIRFHNGRVATSEDLEFALIRGFFSKNRSFYRIYLGNIEGIDDAEGKSFKSGIVKGVKITGPKTVEVTLKAPNPSFLHSLTRAYFSLVAKEAMNDDFLTWKTAPVGVGLYKVSKPFHNGVTVLELASTKFRGTPVVELYTKDVVAHYDIILLAQDPKKIPDHKMVLSEFPAGVVSVFFSFQNALGANESFRKMIRAALDPVKLCQDLTLYRPMFGLLPKQFWGREPYSNPYSSEEVQLLKKNIPKSVFEKTYRVPVFGSKNTMSFEKKTLIDRVKAQLLQIGFKIEPYLTTEKFMTTETAKDVPFELMSQVVDYIDPLIMFAKFRKNSAFFATRPENDEKIENFYLSAEKVLAREDRVETVKALARYMYDKAYVIRYAEDFSYYYLDPNTVKSVGKQYQPNTFAIENVEMKSTN